MNWKKDLAVLSCGVFLSGASYTMIVPFLPLYLIDLGVSGADVRLWSGIVFGATFLVSGILSPYWGRQADRAGKRRMVIRAGLSLAAVYFLGSLVRSPLELLGVRVLQGVAVGFVAASMAIISSSLPEDKIGFGLGIMQTGSLIGNILGPFMGGMLAHFFGIRTSFQVAAAVVFIATAAVRILVAEPPLKPGGTAGSVASDLRAALQNYPLRLMLGLLFTVQMVAIMLQPLITLYIAELNASFAGAEVTAGIVFSLAGIAGAIAAPLWGNAGQRRGFWGMLSIAMTGAGAAVAAQFFSTDIIRFAGLHFVFGLFLAGTIPAINSIIVQSTDESFRGRAFGLAMSANQLGSMIGPLLGGAISSVAGIRPVFAMGGLLMMLIGLTFRKWAGSVAAEQD